MKTETVDTDFGTQLQIDFDIKIENLPLSGDLRNIRNMLPQLFDHQIEDVQRAEKRFEEGKGYLFTNGTGTGKTFVGLGIVKRFYESGKKEILIVVPTDKKAKDWVKDGELLDLNIYKTLNIDDPGIEITITTYANFYQNEVLAHRVFDLVIYDESHYLNQNAKGEETVYHRQHKRVVNVPSAAIEKAELLAGLKPEYDADDPMYLAKLRHWKHRYNYELSRLVERTKVVFLSATPFAYHKSIQYADGCLFNINEGIDDEEIQTSGYNEAVGFDSFMQENFGYRMRYNKLTVPEADVNQDLMERNFFEKLKEEGVASTRVLELEHDYSRDFVTIDNEIASFIDDGIKLLRSDEFKKKYKFLSYYGPRKHNYIFVNQLLECIKAQKVGERIKKHIALGRKVVVFHGYNNNTLKHPFKFDAESLLKKDEKSITNALENEIKRFELEYPEYVNLDLSVLKNTRAAIKSIIPNALEFNGTVPKKKRAKNADLFNDDESGYDVIIVQERAGKEGISFHDTTGKKQRVLINLGLPVAPTSAIQIEGRIYRALLMSDAIYEYITLQMPFEQIAFAQKIAERSKTAENLAMGNLARDLETAFKEGYLSSSYFEPHLGQGKGGKESDRQIQSISEFEKAITFYYARAKKTSKNKAKEGIDYFATPEPLGLKMVEWLDLKENESVLEPSAGHGAIGRFLPQNTKNKFVEPSYSLTAELEINCKGIVYNQKFEDYYYGNKFDAVVMNPPFGVGGKTAAEHIEKAIVHLKLHGHSRIIAIVPQGASMDKRLDRIYNSERFEKCKVTAEILLPACTFERAGTKVFTKIIMIEKGYGIHNKPFASYDLTRIETIKEFFNEIENLEL